MTTTKETPTMTKTEAREMAEHARTLRSHGMTHDQAEATALVDTETAFSIADDLFALVESGEITLDEADARISALVAEAIR